MRGRIVFYKYKKVLDFLSKLLNFFPINFQQKLFILVRNMKGTKGLGLRYSLLRNLSRSCGENVSIHPNVFLHNIESIAFGDNVSIHPMCYIDGAGGLNIGNDVSIAHSVSILTSTHNFENKEINIKDQGVRVSPVDIENDVWIGCKATVLLGVRIKKGSVIGAHTLVNRDTNNLSINIGTPFKEVRRR